MLRLRTSCAVLLDGGVGEMTNLCNHQANRRVSAAVGGRNGHNPINVQ